MKKIVYRLAVRCVLALTFVSLYGPSVAQSASGDAAENRGAIILEKQLQKAQYLRELEYQAEVLERQARIAKAQENIDKTTHVELGLGKKQAKSPAIPASQRLPTVIALSQYAVTFQFADGVQGEYKPGDELPSGHQFIAVSMSRGALLEKNGKQVRVNYQWSP